MRSLSEPADSHVLASPRGRCRRVRQEFRLKVATGLLATAAALAFVFRIGLTV